MISPIMKIPDVVMDYTNNIQWKKLTLDDLFKINHNYAIRWYIPQKNRQSFYRQFWFFCTPSITVGFVDSVIDSITDTDGYHYILYLKSSNSAIKYLSVKSFDNRGNYLGDIPITDTIFSDVEIYEYAGL